MVIAMPPPGSTHPLMFLFSCVDAKEKLKQRKSAAFHRMRSYLLSRWPWHAVIHLGKLLLREKALKPGISNLDLTDTTQLRLHFSETSLFNFKLAHILFHTMEEFASQLNSREQFKYLSSAAGMTRVCWTVGEHTGKTQNRSQGQKRG